MISACRSASLVTSASLHDSQVAIPLIKMTSNKVTYLYDLMDAAYDAQLIADTCRKFGHVPIVNRNGRGKEVIPRHLTKQSVTRFDHVRNERTVD